jgi:G3E family GTPase
MVKVEDWLERLVEEKGEDLYRMKGVLSVDGSEQRYVFQVLFYNIIILLLLTLFPFFNLSSSNLFFALTLFLYYFQGVHSMLDDSPGKTWEPQEKRINKLVFIGRNLDETALRKGFKGCLV